MHDTADLAGKFFAEGYYIENQTVVDVGGLSVNGSLKKHFKNANFICVDLEPHESVDIVIKPGDPLPFQESSVDIIISTSCFEHDPCFWITFKEMCRILKIGGYIYINAPSNGPYHGHPGDNWRFYADAGQALAYWAGICNYPVKVEETFILDKTTDVWNDFVCVFKRTEIKETEIVKKNLNQNIKLKIQNLNIIIEKQNIVDLYYGSDDVKIKVNYENLNLIPSGDANRANIFGDPVLNVYKSIFIKFKDSTTVKYSDNTTITLR